MTTMDEIESKIDPKTLSHSNWLHAFADTMRQRGELDSKTVMRLYDISCLLKYRPDIDMTGDFQFEVGKTYPTRGGKLVTIISKGGSKGYECVQGDDGTPKSGFRYCRSTNTTDHGRVTGGKGDNDRNLLPIEITDSRITGAKLFESGRFIVLSTAHVSKETATQLDDAANRDWILFGAPYGEYGWLIASCDAMLGNPECWKIPTDLLNVMQFARKNGFDSILFDRDGDTLEELPTWDW